MGCKMAESISPSASQEVSAVAQASGPSGSGATATAGHGTRFLAFLIDGLICTALSLAFVIPGLFYYLCRDSFGTTGRSWGRKAADCRVVGNDGMPLSKAKCFWRNLVKWLCYTVTLGFFAFCDCVAVLARGDKRSLVDLMFDTKVIRCQSAHMTGGDPSRTA